VLGRTAEFLDDTGNIVDPGVLVMRRHRKRLSQLPGTGAPGLRRRCSDAALQIDRNGKNKSLVVVGVLAD
jgi:hypothetical protein